MQTSCSVARTGPASGRGRSPSASVRSLRKPGCRASGSTTFATALRHSRASGVDLKTVSTRLGHSSIVITADLYAHVLPATDRAAAEKVAEMVLPLRAVTNL